MSSFHFFFKAKDFLHLRRCCFSHRNRRGRRLEAIHEEHLPQPLQAGQGGGGAGALSCKLAKSVKLAPLSQRCAPGKAERPAVEAHSAGKRKGPGGGGSFTLPAAAHRAACCLSGLQRQRCGLALPAKAARAGWVGQGACLPRKIVSEYRQRKPPRLRWRPPQQRSPALARLPSRLGAPSCKLAAPP